MVRHNSYGYAIFNKMNRFTILCYLYALIADAGDFGGLKVAINQRAYYFFITIVLIRLLRKHIQV